MQTQPPSVGQAAPPFRLPAVRAGDVRTFEASLEHYAGRWVILVFYPRDFSFVCPTELTAFSSRQPDFAQRGCEILGVSVDELGTHREWLDTPPDGGGIGPLRFPLASDTAGDTAKAYGIWVPEKRVANRGLFVIDPEGRLQYSVVHNLSVGRSTDEVLRVLDALRTGGLCPVSWMLADGTLDPRMVLKPGRVLGHYRIREPLGEGSFGSVFAAWDLDLHRMVALKVLRRQSAGSRRQVLAEARAAASLLHPNICTVYAVEEEDGVPVIAMEHLPGGTLSQRLAADDPQHSEDRVRELALGIARGLAAAHRRGVAHGDLKPANILFDEDHVPKLVDFGLSAEYAQATQAGDTHGDDVAERGPQQAAPPRSAGPQPSPGDDPHDLERTQALPVTAVDGDFAATASWHGGLRGTPLYLAPERFASGGPPDTAGDVFAFGLLLYELFTRRPALGADDLTGVWQRATRPELADELAEHLPEAWRGLLRELLNTDPAARPTMADVVEKLERASDGA